MKKRVLTAAVCVALLLSILPVKAQAASPTVSLSVGEISRENTVDVTVSLAYNPGIISMILEVGYDAGLMTLVRVSDGGLLGNALHTDNLTLNPYQLTWDNGLAAADYTATGTIATLTFRLAEDALPGTYPITLTCRDTLNYNLDDVVFTAVGSQITIRETAPTEILALSVLEVTPERATVRLTAEQDCTLAVALYTMDNKLMDVRLVSISGGSGEQEIPVSVSSGGLRIFTARAFLLDGTFCWPACQKYEVCIDRTVD